MEFLRHIAIAFALCVASTIIIYGGYFLVTGAFR